MPRPKKKLKTSSRKKSRVIQNASFSSPKPRIRIPRHKFHGLKNDKNFLTIVKIGRLLNAISFGAQSYLDYAGDKSSIGRRQFFRATLITGGYLYEGLLLVDSLKNEYRLKEYFKNLLALANDSKSRKILQSMRHIAFHLDSDDKSSRDILPKLDLARYDLMSGDTGKVGDFYFDFADTIDINYLTKPSKRDSEQVITIETIASTLGNITEQFLKAGHEFLVSLAQEFKLYEYVE